jgi:hypothetical protein
MKENELDRMLDRWKAPAVPPRLRARVLAGFPRRERLWFGRPVRWAAAMAVMLVIMAVGAEQAKHGALDDFAAGLRQAAAQTGQWFDDMWIGHIMMAFRNSSPKVLVDGELQNDSVVGGSGGGLWVQLAGEGKYYASFHLGTYRGPSVPAQFDGHALEFVLGGRQVRIESRKHYGFGGPRNLYMVGPIVKR